MNIISMTKMLSDYKAVVSELKIVGVEVEIKHGFSDREFCFIGAKFKDFNDWLFTDDNTQKFIKIARAYLLGRNHKSV